MAIFSICIPKYEWSYTRDGLIFVIFLTMWVVGIYQGLYGCGSVFEKHLKYFVSGHQRSAPGLLKST